VAEPHVDGKVNRISKVGSTAAPKTPTLGMRMTSMTALSARAPIAIRTSAVLRLCSFTGTTSKGPRADRKTYGLMALRTAADSEKPGPSKRRA
jgi:hypothetical protein